MCGIFGYTGNRQAKSIILNGLKKLEYRGYDSAGLSVLFNNEIVTKKCVGEVSNLKESEELKGKIGIGHTRWATHGSPSLLNAHPHNSFDNAFSVVHNGIIENYADLKKEVAQKGYKLQSDTDSEIIPALMQVYYNGDVLDTLLNIITKLKGSFAVAIISRYENKIYAFKSGSPLIVGTEESESYISSDVYALSGKVSSYYILNDCEIAIISDSVLLYDFNGNSLQVNFIPFDIVDKPYEKNNYEHFMIKEICEQPFSAGNTILEFLKKKSELNDLNFNNIYILGCGSAYNAGLVGAYFLENICKINTRCIIASEYLDNCSVITRNDLVIAISQSGETADTLSAVKYIKNIGCKIVSVINVKSSSLESLSDTVFFTNAGKEISVATTKCYTSQCLMLILIADYFKADNKIPINADALKTEIKNAIDIDVSKMVNKIDSSNNIFFLGKGIDYYTALEGALKLKEVSYVNAQAYPSGELKHGSIALIDEKTTVILICTDKKHLEKNISAAKEVKSRGAFVISILNFECSALEDVSDYSIVFSSVNKFVYPLLSVIPLQLIAYHSGKSKNIDVDKPRNLAKSVTVE